MRVGCWPPPKIVGNHFLRNVCNALSAEGVKIVPVENLSCLNPDEIDILKIHWPEQIFWARLSRWNTFRKICSTLSALRHIRRSGVKIVLMAHNLRPHTRSLFNDSLWYFYHSILLRLIDAYITLSPATVPIVRQKFKLNSRILSSWIRCPLYVVPAEMSSENLRSQLQIPENALVFVIAGYLRENKNIIEASRAFISWGNLNAYLVLAGSAEGKLAKPNGAHILEHQNIKILFRELTDEEYNQLIDLADFVLMPAHNYLHSSSIIHAISFARPCITPLTPYAGELSRVIGDEYILTYSGPLRAEILAAAKKPKILPRNLDQFDSRIGARATIELFQRLKL